jgi:ribosomal protein L37E
MWVPKEIAVQVRSLLISQNICIECGTREIANWSKSRCSTCLYKIALRQRKYKEKNKEEYNKKRRIQRAKQKVLKNGKDRTTVKAKSVTNQPRSTSNS